MDILTLLFILTAVILGIGLYFLSKRTKNANRMKISEAPQKSTEFETAEEVFPTINFPPDPVREYIPDLPEEYNHNNITIMARDPEWIFAYWETDDSLRRKIMELNSAKWENSYPVLRVYDITDIENFDGTNAVNHYDIVINDYSNHWYIHTKQANKSYCVELGRILNDGSYLLLARSNKISTPRNRLSDKVDPEWMLVSDKEKRLYRAIGQNENLSSAELFRLNVSSFKEN